MTTKSLEESIKSLIAEAIDAYIDEAGQDLRARMSAAASGQKDAVDVSNLLAAIKKSGKDQLTMADLSNLARQSIALNAPLGRGSSQQLAQQTSRTGGAPVHAPLGAGNLSASPFSAREGKVVVEKEKLQEMISGIVRAKLLEFTGMGVTPPSNNPIMAKREIIALMDTTSRNFENEILKTFDLQHPDTLGPELQRKYLEVVEGMKAKLVGAAMEAVGQLIRFPRNDEGNGPRKS